MRSNVYFLRYPQDLEEAKATLKTIRGNFLFCDAGLGKGNPSPICMSHAAIFTVNGVPVNRISGALPPSTFGMQTVECNLAELVSLTLALETLPDGWEGTICCDSKSALNRVWGTTTWGGVPSEWRHRARAAADRMGALFIIRLDGHPTDEQLTAGIGHGGAPVHKFNRACDKLCGKESRKYARSIRIAASAGSAG